MSGRTRLAFALAAPMAGCTRYDSSLFGAAGQVAADERQHFLLIVALVAVVVVPAVILGPWVARRYRYGRADAAYDPDWEFSWWVEVPLWGVPVALVAVLGTVLWRSTVDLDPYEPVGVGPVLDVQAIGYDWKWLFLYPGEGIASVGVMAVPQGRPVRIRLTSGANLMSFHVPALAGQIYAMPGMVTEQNLVAERTGQFLGQNTQYNGRGFHEQKFVTEAMDETGFDDFVARAHAAPPLDAATMAAVEARSTKGELADILGLPDGGSGPMPPILFGSVPPGLFDQVVRRFAHDDLRTGGQVEEGG